MKTIKRFGSILFGLALLFPSLSNAATFTKTLSYGVTSTEVSNLQQFLTGEYLYFGPITSTFGTATKNAVISFQKQEKITPTSGIFGPLTRTRANAILTLHPEWIQTTTLSNNNMYTNVDGNTIHGPAYSSNGIPAGATAECGDGTYSFSQNHRGSCSHHGGVSSWLQ